MSSLKIDRVFWRQTIATLGIPVERVMEIFDPIFDMIESEKLPFKKKEEIDEQQLLDTINRIFHCDIKCEKVLFISYADPLAVMKERLNHLAEWENLERERRKQIEEEEVDKSSAHLRGFLSRSIQDFRYFPGGSLLTVAFSTASAEIKKATGKLFYSPQRKIVEDLFCGPGNFDEIFLDHFSRKIFHASCKDLRLNENTSIFDSKFTFWGTNAIRNQMQMYLYAQVWKTMREKDDPSFLIDYIPSYELELQTFTTCLIRGLYDIGTILWAVVVCQ